MDSQSLTERLKEEARRLGFSLGGACPAVTPEGLHRFRDWLDAGHAGEMHYLPRRREAYADPRHVLDGARSLLMLAMPYATLEPEVTKAGQGRVSRYAWGTDYHDVIRDRLNRLAAMLRQHVSHGSVRGVVDTAPLLEREFAQLAGLGWIGKNTMLLNRSAGSWFFLAALITDVVLDYDEPHRVDHCGTCRACLDACPTDAFVDAGVLDSRRCISYLTIELKSPVPRTLRRGMGSWLFGCDICQEVCPWNERAGSTALANFSPLPGTNPLDLAPLFTMDDEAFRRRFRATPLWRPRRRGLLRNAAIVLGNHGDPAALPALERGLCDREPLVRGASAWALGEIGGSGARRLLRERITVEDDADVGQEILAAVEAATA